MYLNKRDRVRYSSKQPIRKEWTERKRRVPRLACLLARDLGTKRVIVELLFDCGGNQQARKMVSPTYRPSPASHVMRVLICSSLASDQQTAPLRGRTVGIDLGTTNSAIAILTDGAPEIVPNSRGELTTPSVVSYRDDGSVIVGANAVVESSCHVLNTVYAAKRFIGRPFSSVQAYKAAAGAAVCEGNAGEPVFVLPARPDERVRPEEVSAQVLRALLDDAERHTGLRAERAVVAIPAYFDEQQRFATLTAARLAGLSEVQLLAEPVAACVAHQLKGGTGTILVFDLGAGER